MTRDPAPPRRRRPRAAYALALLVAATAAGGAAAAGDAKRGEYLAAAGGCAGCHTENRKDAVPFAGGRALATPFGTFYGPNLTPHPQAGLGRWTETDFVRAMRQGVRPDGAHHYPAFPYASFARITDADLADLWAYLRALPPDPRPGKAHELRWPFRWRYPLALWKWLYFDAGPPAGTAMRDGVTARGAYLAEVLGHCGECHTPRNYLGGLRRDRHFAGGKGPEGKDLPNLTPTRLKKWTDAELDEFLVTGMTPDMDSANATMAEVIRNTTSRLTPEDRAALIAYLRALPPLPEPPR